MHEYGDFIASHFAHHQGGVFYSGSPASRVAGLQGIIDVALVDTSGRRRLDCEGFYHLACYILGGIENGGAYRTRALQVPGHITTLVESQDGQAFLVNNEAVVDLGRAKGSTKRALTLIAGGHSTFFSLSAIEDDTVFGHIYDAQTKRIRAANSSDRVAYYIAISDPAGRRRINGTDFDRWVKWTR